MLAGALVLVLAAAGCGGDDADAVLGVQHAWARTTPPGATNGVVYFELTTAVDDRLTGVSVDPSVAASAGLHESMGGSGGGAMPGMPGMDGSGDGTMTMTPLASVDVDAGSPLVLEPGGRHVMLEGLVAGLRAGDVVHLVLHLEVESDVEVDAVVADNPPGG